MSAPITRPAPLPAQPSLRQVLAYNLRALRFEKGLSQEALALLCDLDRTYVSAVERCAWNVSLANIERFAKQLDVQPWQLLRPERSIDADRSDQEAV